MKSTPRSPVAPLARSALHLDVQFCFALYSTLLGVNKVYRKALRALDLTYPQYLVLLVLWERDGINVSEICHRLFLETTTLTPLLKRLEAAGLVTRTRLPSDERNVIVHLTEAGRAMRQRAEGIPACVASAMDCPEAELQSLRERLERLRDHLFSAG